MLYRGSKVLFEERSEPWFRGYQTSSGRLKPRLKRQRDLFGASKGVTRHRFTAEEKIRIVLEGFQRDTPIRDLCRREAIRPSTYYAWLKEFMEAGKNE